MHEYYERQRQIARNMILDSISSEPMNVTQIAGECYYAETSVRRYLPELLAEGLIECGKRHTGYRFEATYRKARASSQE